MGFQYKRDTGMVERFQITEIAAHSSLYGAFRIARHCYRMFDEGAEASEVAQTKKDLLARIKGKTGDGDASINKADGLDTAPEASSVNKKRRTVENGDVADH